jgi:hypothetical protein
MAKGVGPVFSVRVTGFERGAVNGSFDGISRRKVCRREIFGRQYRKTHLVIQNIENSWQVSLLGPQRLVIELP